MSKTVNRFVSCVTCRRPLRVTVELDDDGSGERCVYSTKVDATCGHEPGPDEVKQYEEEALAAQDAHDALLDEVAREWRGHYRDFGHPRT